MLRFVPAALLALAACSPPATPTDNVMSSAGATDRAVANVALPSPTPSPSLSPLPRATAAATMDEAYLGRWIGVEGMVLDVARKPGGGLRLDMQWDLDHRGRFDGTATAAGLRFVRDGVAETAVPSDGDATGLKYLAGKRHCLTVKPGEGYCRG